MPNTKPLVAVASVCEHVLEETDKVLSVIRIVDTFGLQPSPDLPSEVKPGLDLRLLVSLKSGDVTGSREIRLVLRPPTGEAKEIHRGLFEFKGAEHGINLKMRFIMPAANFGLYWFDVLDGEEVLTSIPLKLVRAATETAR